MLPAARILLPVSLSVLVVIYKYFKSRRQSEFSEGDPPSDQPVPSPAPSDLELEILNLIQAHPALLNRIRNRDPALLDEIRKFDPTVEIRNFDSAFPSEFSVGVDAPLNRPSVPSPEPSALEILDWIQTLDPAVLDEVQQFDPAFLDEIRNFDPSIADEIRKLSLRKKAEKEKEEKERETAKENEKERETEWENEKERESEKSQGGNKNGGELEKEVVEASSRRNQYPLRPDTGDCSYSLKTGNCKFGSNCKFNNPRGRKNNQSEQSDGGGRGEGLGGNQGWEEDGGGVEETQESNRRYQYPVRPEAEDCSYYLKTGSCKFGSNCKFNHPVRRKTNQVPKEGVKEKDESAENPSQMECKYYLRSGGCKYGQACRYSHSNVKPSVAPVLELNFLGLPIRPGERECPYYMRNGSCKYASNCRFNHPDPTATGGSDSPSGYGNGGPASLQGASQSTVAPWSAPRPLNEAPVYSTLMIPPPQVVSSQKSEWNGRQAPAYLPHRSMPAPPPYVMNNSVTETNFDRQYAQLKQVEELPERPGQPVCSCFAQTGDCNYKSNCKYHHPKYQTAATPSCALSDRGLPLRPGQNICTQYSRFGVCSSGATCRFDHPSLSDSFL